MSDNDIDRYYEIMNESRQNIKKINSDIDVYRNMRKVLQGQLKKGCANKCCPLCERSMNDEQLNKVYIYYTYIYIMWKFKSSYIIIIILMLYVILFSLKHLLKEKFKIHEQMIKSNNINRN